MCVGKNTRKTSSRLVIARVEKEDSGNYTCSTTNAEPSTITVFVSEGKLWITISATVLHMRCAGDKTLHLHDGVGSVRPGGLADLLAWVVLALATLAPCPL